MRHLGQQRSLVQLLAVVSLMLILGLIARLIGVPSGWAAMTGIVLAGSILGLWNGLSRPDR